MRRFLIISIALVMVAACRQPVTPARDTIALVKDIAAGTYAQGREVVVAAARPSSSGEIFIAGSPEYSERLVAEFLECDIVYNTRGSAWSDGLKDFAGETFSCICDGTFSPYGSIHSSDSLRELAVRLAIAALDTKCNVSVYDLDANATKAQAKVLILSDPWLLEYGKFDIDTLFAMTSCRVPVISPQELMLDAVFTGEHKAFNVGIICDSAFVGTGIYPRIFNSGANGHSIVGARCFEGAGSLYDFLDSYIAAGHTEPLDAILVDDLSLDQSDLESQLSAIRDFSLEESMLYGKYVSPRLEIINSGLLTMRKCYDILRGKDLFTHKIAMPLSRYYDVQRRPWSEDMQFLLIPRKDV